MLFLSSPSPSPPSSYCTINVFSPPLVILHVLLIEDNEHFKHGGELDDYLVL